MDQQLQVLIHLQGVDSKIASLESEEARLPQLLEAIRREVAQAVETMETLKATVDATRKEIHLKEKDLEFSAAKRAKGEARLYEVKTNKEYSAVLMEIEEVKQEKSRIEEQVLALMERQERLAGEIREAEARRQSHEAKGKLEEAEVTKRLVALQADLALLRSDRGDLARQLPAELLASYDKLLRHRAQLAVVPVLPSAICGGCRVSLTPQTFQELKQRVILHTCESCGRYLYWSPE